MSSSTPDSTLTTQIENASPGNETRQRPRAFGELTAEEMMRRAAEPNALRHAKQLTEAQQRALYSPWLEITTLAQELRMFQPANYYQLSPLRGTLGLPGLAISSPPITTNTVHALARLGLVERWEECRDRYGETIESNPYDNPKHTEIEPTMISEEGEILGAALMLEFGGDPQGGVFRARQLYNELRAAEIQRRESSSVTSESLLRELEEELRAISIDPAERARLLRGYNYALSQDEARQNVEPQMPITVSAMIKLLASARASGREEGLREGESDYW